MISLTKPIRVKGQATPGDVPTSKRDSSSLMSFSRPVPVPKSVLPSLITMSAPEVTKREELTSETLLRELQSRGMIFTRAVRQIRSYPAAMYSDKTRALDSSDLFKGKPQIYSSDLQYAISIYAEWKKFNDWFIEYCKKRDDIPARIDLGDAEKACYQFLKPTGWWLTSPITKASVPLELPPAARAMLRRVVREVYLPALKRSEVAAYDRKSLMLADSDPDDTNVGAPTYLTGEQTHQARLTTLAALPSAALPPAEFLKRVEILAHRLGLPDKMIYSPIVSTRMGPYKKPVQLWYKSGNVYRSDYDSLGLLNRTRFVYPAPYWVNLLLSPWYEQMSNARKNILGLWHDPDHQEQYIKVLQKQGKYCYAIDFSGMDTAMWQSIIIPMIEELTDAGFDQWTGRFFRELYPRMGIMFPDYYGDPRSVMIASGPVRPWCSGFKLTSEFDTLYGASVLMFVLQRQVPDIFERWRDGKFTFLELGDDIMFTIDQPLDAQRIADDALHFWGATLKLEEDVVFLKWELPVHPDVPKKTRLFSRFLQQTLANEDQYVGKEGGDVPDCVMRLALVARSAGLADNPMFRDVWPRVANILHRLPYVQSASDEFKRSVDSGRLVVTQEDAAGVLLYGKRSPQYFSNLIERAKYEPSAAFTLRMMQEAGIPVTQDPSAPAARALYVQQLFAAPTDADVLRLRSLTDKSA